ncbi:MAG: methyltransferase domain-containing protein [Alphaproteobacteria bacterium]
MTVGETNGHAARAERLLAVGRGAEAVSAFDQALSLEPGHVGHLRGLVAALAQVGDGGRVASVCERLLALRPDCGPTRLAVARALARVGADEDALAHYREVSFLRPADLEARVELAERLIRRGDLPEAIDLLQRCLRDDPDLLAAHFHLGRAWAALGDAAAASLRFRHCLDLDPADALGAAPALAAVAGASPEALPDAFIRCLFDQYAARFDEELVIRLRYRGPEVVRAAVDAVLGEAVPGEDRRLRDVLDLGCGTGLAGEHLRPLAHRLAGVDLSPAMVAKARDRGLYDDLWVGEAVAALGAASAAWDLVVAADVLVYLGDLGPLFTAAAAALRPGGLLAATVEESDGPAFELMPTRRFRHHPDHLRQGAAAAGLAMAHLEPVVTRFERSEPVRGLVFVARLP